MAMFEQGAKQFKFGVLKEVCKRAFEKTLNDDSVDEIADLIITANMKRYRCCSYKEKEIIRQRTRLALGKPPVTSDKSSEKQIVRVVDAACDGCSIHKIQVTNNCRKCLAKKCLSSCKFGAIHMGENQAFIDYDACKECGACQKACPFGAIIETQRPCRKSCPVEAINFDNNNFAVIDETRCINCGACQESCPFGAIGDISWMVPTINCLTSDEKTIAIIAPAIQGQFENLDLPKIIASIKKLGFDEVYEAAVGADAVAWYEKEDAKKHFAEGKKITTSCCPAFVNLAKIHFPSVYEENVSHMVSPMIATARYLKKHYPNHKLVFIGPCVAKKQEVQNSEIDFALTFEELGAMIVVKGITPDIIGVKNVSLPSVFGRNFSIGGGVANAVKEALREAGDTEIKCDYADGIVACKKAMFMLKAGKFEADILEGMACVGGCVNGPAKIEDVNIAKARMNKDNEEHKDALIEKTINDFDFADIDLRVQR